MQKFIAQLGQLQERFNLLAEATRAQFKTLGIQLNVMQNSMQATGQRFARVEDRLKAVEVAIHETQEAVHETQAALQDTRRAMVETSETLGAWVRNYLEHLEVVNHLFELITDSMKKSDDMEARIQHLETLEARLNARFETLEKRLPPANP